ncbi:hypothetical protein [Legionella septentrionalis]|uniref:hypothetical protein n=1 Tax=Legionella septentrionalis TaxID=2498109 RepID=UPI000F8E1BF1|nr:hypothetical protein [Legionella septentrionalis]RUQ92919.1 hypothetical protein ELY11_11990 [Legionella septentrionalis]
MSAPSHPDKDIKKAIDEAVLNNWTVKKLGLGGNSHAWGKITCPAKFLSFPHAEWCAMIIYTTPKNPSNMAKMILRKVKKCTH